VVSKQLSALAGCEPEAYLWLHNNKCCFPQNIAH